MKIIFFTIVNLEEKTVNLYEFYTGKEFAAYEYLGAHIEANEIVFRTFAPGAADVKLIGECTGWDEWHMNRIHDGSIFECRTPLAWEGMLYKYRIYKKDGSYVDHCDPYGFGMEQYGTASVVRNLSSHQFGDQKWMKRRTTCMNSPMNIYEVHAGSWKRPNVQADKGGMDEEQSASANENRKAWYTYTELAELMIPYLKDMGYNYVEFMPLAEHPCDASWGYQCTGFYAPTFRYGTAEQLMKMVDMFHQNDIGVLLDFVPVHFAVDGYALSNYDGTCLYEYPNGDVGYNEWGSKNFNHSRGEVRSFLQSAANYWLTVYHFDGLRMDAISNIIYWQGNESRGVNGNAVDFIRTMNHGLKDRHPTCILSAEDSTAFLKVTAPVLYDGLGFDYKWDMGWMNDTLDYFRTDPLFRGGDGYNRITFSMLYFYQENYMLPLSHDEVVHGKATIAQKMFGEYEMKFPQLRAFYMYMYVHPGKKLNFMGNELGQLREWSEEREQDWDILKYPMHDSFHRYVRELNRLYLGNPALYAEEQSESGFAWLDCESRDKCIYAMRRDGGGRSLMCILNFSGVRQSYSLFLGNKAEPELILHSDWERFSGGTRESDVQYTYKDGNLKTELPAFSGMIFEIKKG